MQHSRIQAPFVARGIALLCAVVLVTCAASTTLAAGVVGSGTAFSCTDSALDAALAGGGVVTFNCGASPATITIFSTKTISADTTIDGGNLITIRSPGQRAFQVNATINFTVRNITIADSFTGTDFDCAGTRGGAIRNDGGTVIISDSTLSGNGAFAYCGEVCFCGEGGAIANLYPGTVTVTNSTFFGNVAAGFLHNSNDIINTGILTITNSTFRSGELTVLGMIFDPGVFNDGTLTVDDSTFSSRNTAGIGNRGTVTITSSAFSDTFVVNTDPPGLVVVANSTFSGGGLSNGAGTSIVINCTFSAAINNGLGTLTLTNSIVASVSGPNCGGPITDGGHNLDSDGTCGVGAATDPLLDPAGLSNHGGPTQTIALLAGSPAIGAGDPAVCANPPVNGLDQRGYVRPGASHTGCSIGAYDAAACPAAPATTCFAAGKSIVQLRENDDPSKQRLLWKWNKGLPPLVLDDLGDPVNGGTAYTLCVYDQTAAVPELKMSAAVAAGGTCGAAPCWSGGTRGWSYKNGAGNADGITRLFLKSGGAGTSKLQVKAVGASLPLPAPLSGSKFFAQDPAVIVQLYSSTNPASCWSSSFTTAKRNDGVQFKATAP